MNLLCFSVLFALAGEIFAAEFLPSDVLSFVDGRETCDHFRGEPWNAGDEPEIRARREFIFDNIKKYCTGTDKRLEELRSKYRHNPEILERLQHYENHVESQ